MKEKIILIVRIGESKIVPLFVRKYYILCSEKSNFKYYIKTLYKSNFFID